jgi:hypothetical protein
MKFFAFRNNFEIAKSFEILETREKHLAPELVKTSRFLKGLMNWLLSA